MIQKYARIFDSCNVYCDLTDYFSINFSTGNDYKFSNR